jgi:hypothetical protein
MICETCQRDVLFPEPFVSLSRDRPIPYCCACGNGMSAVRYDFLMRLHGLDNDDYDATLH